MEATAATTTPVKSEFSCAYYDATCISTGILRISEDYITFKPNSSYKKELNIPFHLVTSLEKTKTANVLHSGICIETPSSTYCFSSFSSRDEAFLLLGNGVYACNLKGGAAKSSTTTTTTHHELPPHHQNNNHHQQQQHHNNNNNHHQQQQHHRNQNKHRRHPIVPTELTTPIAPKSNFPVDFSTVSSNKVFTANPISVASPSCERFFETILSDSSSFFKELYDSRGYADFTCSKWRLFGENQGPYVRVLQYRVSINAPVGPKETRVTETQRCSLVRSEEDDDNSGKASLTFDSFSHSLDVPCAGSFNVVTRWDLQMTTDASCTLSVTGGPMFSKSCFIKGIIEKTCLNDLRVIFGMIEKKIHSLVFQPHEPALEDEQQQQQQQQQQQEPTAIASPTKTSPILMANQSPPTVPRKSTREETNTPPSSLPPQSQSVYSSSPPTLFFSPPENEIGNNIWVQVLQAVYANEGPDRAHLASNSTDNNNLDDQEPNRDEFWKMLRGIESSVADIGHDIQNDHMVMQFVDSVAGAAESFMSFGEKVKGMMSPQPRKTEKFYI